MRSDRVLFAAISALQGGFPYGAGLGSGRSVNRGSIDRTSAPSRETDALCSGEPSYFGNAPSFRSATIRCSRSC